MPSEKIRRGEVARIATSINSSRPAHELNKLPIYIDDTPALTIAGVRTRARRLKRKNKLGLVIIDYLQLLRADTGQLERKPRAGSLPKLHVA